MRPTTKVNIAGKDSTVGDETQDNYERVDDKKNYEYVKHITRNSKSNAEYIPLSFDYDVIMMGLHGGPEWQGGTHDKLNDQIIIPTNISLLDIGILHNGSICLFPINKLFKRRS